MGARTQLIKPCRVMLERRREMRRENQVDCFQHIQGKLKFHINPRTVKMRMENEQFFLAFIHRSYPILASLEHQHAQEGRTALFTPESSHWYLPVPALSLYP